MKAKLLPFILLFTLIGCEPFLEDDISDKTVVILGPTDKDTSDLTSQTFWWEEMDEAANFRFQIVSPSFSNASNLYKDTLLVDNRVVMSLIPGEYEWQVRGENGETETAYQTRSLVVVTSDDLTNQTINLISPLNNTLLSDTINVKFSWDKLLAAESYHLLVVRGAFDNPQETIVDESNLTTNSYTLAHINTYEELKSYSWRVRALNETTNTDFSLPQSFLVDSTKAYIEK